tara:strand:- start:636 stop:854 length:219 start_codon:yes stop_codon:yes gene_type:complete
MDNKQFIEEVYEIAFGDNAINRKFSHEEVIEQLKEINKDSVKWDQVNDYDKEFYEQQLRDEAADHFDQCPQS